MSKISNPIVPPLDPAVTASVDGSEVTLTGHLETWAERHEAEYAAWCTPGVSHVDDRITIGSEGAADRGDVHAGETAEVLDEHECWRLLRSTTLGRLAISVDGAPDIFPINYAVDHGTLVFRTAEGTKLVAVRRDGVLAIEADGFDPEHKAAWSVVLRGNGHRINELYDLVQMSDLPLFPWAAGAKNQFVRVVPNQISGRRIGVVDPRRWKDLLTDAPHSAME